MPTEIESDDLTPPGKLTREADPTARFSPPPKRAAPRANSEREAPRGDEPRLTRQTTTDDAFHIPKELIPPNVSYEWKRASCYGMPDHRHMNQLRRNHWRNVPQDRHPDYLVEQDGMVLMERPLYLTQEAHQESYATARGRVEQVTASVKQTPDGTFTRNHPSVERVARIKSSVERMEIPDA